MNTKDIFDIFDSQIIEYHKTDNIDEPSHNPYSNDTFEYLLWEKSHIDTVQWHLEDLIRPDDIDPVEALKLKRRIDKSNQNRTDLVERIDDYYLSQLQHVTTIPNAKINTETPAWAIDRLSILALKIYHFGIETNRKGASAEHYAKCQAKYNILLTQKADLLQAIDDLLEELRSGKKVMKVYRQMKMYNDPSLNPMLYKKEK
ncbi:MAG: DUF4254 domain-containing protein [Bacteroidales bacterium]|nr:DUF4254 domain-containing protein [Candidatus Colimorpha onthohippi]